MTEDEMVGWHHYLKDMSLSMLWELEKDPESLLDSKENKLVNPKGNQP